MLEIKSYENAKDIPEEYLASLVDSQIECWGAKPFDEYMICSDKNCNALHSIEDIHGSIDNYRKEKADKLNCNCYVCGSKLSKYYEKKEYLEMVKEYISLDVKAILLLENNIVEGFGILVEKTLNELLKLELGGRPKSYSNHLVQSNFLEKIEEVFICINHIYVSEKLRGRGNGKKILSEMMGLSGIQDKRLITETRYDSDFYSICKSIGLNEIVNDKYGYVLMELNKKGIFTKENIDNIFNLISINFLKYKKEAIDILNLNSVYSYRKNYD